MTDFFSALSRLISGGVPVVAPSRIPTHRVGRQVSSEFDPKDALNAFRENVLVYRSIMGYMTHAMSVPMTVQVRDGEGVWTDVVDPEQGEGPWRLSRLIRTPDMDMTYQDWTERRIGHMMCAGESFTRKVFGTRVFPDAEIDPRTGKRRFEVVSLESFIPLLEPVPGDDGRIKEWRRNQADKNPVPASQAIVVRLPDLLETYRGLSPIRPARKQIQVHGRMYTWADDSFRNRLASEIVMQRRGPVDLGVMTEEFNKILSLREKAPYKPLGVTDDWDIKALNTAGSAKDMDYTNGLVRVREEVLSGSGSPPVVAGYFDNATLANAGVSVKIFFRYHLIPALERDRAAVEASLVPHFGPMEKIRLRLDTSNVKELVDDLESDSLTFIRLQQGGIPYHEAAELLNLKIRNIGPIGDEPHGVVPPPSSVGGAGERRRGEE